MLVLKSPNTNQSENKDMVNVFLSSSLGCQKCWYQRKGQDSHREYFSYKQNIKALAPNIQNICK